MRRGVGSGADQAARHVLLLEAAMTGQRDTFVAALEQHYYQDGRR